MVSWEVVGAGLEIVGVLNRAPGDPRVDREGERVERLARRDQPVAAGLAGDAAEREVAAAVEPEQGRHDRGVARGVARAEEGGGAGEHARDEGLAELDRAPVAPAA